MGDAMNIREKTEQIEENILSPFAMLSKNTHGRDVIEGKCEIRTEYQRDRDRIIHSKSFRRLKHKTQVFISPEGDHYRTRLTHTLEVAQIARTIARALRLNEDLAEAIALGHDLGHTPFGHSGESVLNTICPHGFKHNEQSLRVVDVLERKGGLNLTYEVRDGILHHTGDGIPCTLEGQVVRYADRIAYINHDVDDALRGKVLLQDELPQDCIGILGETGSNRINTMIKDIVFTSEGEDQINMSFEVKKATDRVRTFMFEHVYIGSTAKVEEKKAVKIIGELYSHMKNNPEMLPKELQQLMHQYDIDRLTCDYVAGMTDTYAVKQFSQIFIPAPWGM